MTTMIKKAHAFEIINHWTLAISCFVLAITGYAFLFHLEGIGAVFGGFEMMKNVHNYAGVVFSASLFLTIFFYLKEALSIDADDIKWLAKGGGYLSKNVTVPPVGKINAGQKLYYLVILTAGIAISVTGFVIWLMPGVKNYIIISHLIHNIAFVIIMLAVPVHIYLATLANPGTVRIMITGEVPLAWAKKRHPKWVKEMGY